jgi:hypothetical protein
MDPTTPETPRAQPLSERLGDPRFRGLIIATAVVALVLAIGAGFAIGFKVEQNRVKDDVKQLKERLTQGSTGPPVGQVTAVRQGSVTITGTTSRDIALSTAPVIYNTVPGTVDDITRDSKILVQAPRGSVNATEIVLLPADSEIGRQVTAVGPGSVTRANPDGTSTEINLTDATVIYTATTGGTAADITQGSTIIVRGKVTQGGSVDAAEIIVLPPDSAFGGSTGS